ncbi:MULTISPECIES: hypothetical protein [unclassified Streptomyces]|uniref:hypothetical protein n=1 Tax=unclassified Streptomyces TaxID=2593676 RepID=UPI0016550942|nr:hypothetical protein [Streptomyces sp. CB02980]MCB8905543.1 hypothetical protein [Streptomyces sp. CB02980]
MTSSTSDDATTFLIEWRGGDADHLATLDRADGNRRYSLSDWSATPSAVSVPSQRGNGPDTAVT